MTVNELISRLHHAEHGEMEAVVECGDRDGERDRTGNAAKVTNVFIGSRNIDGERKQCLVIEAE